MRNMTQVEKFDANHSYEEITDMEVQFLMSLYNAVVQLINEDKKVSLVNISMITKVSPRELTDYLYEITEMERQLNVNATE